MPEVKASIGQFQLAVALVLALHRTGAEEKARLFAERLLYKHDWVELHDLLQEMIEALDSRLEVRNA